MSFATTISALSSKVDGLIANRVAKFAYTQQAYNSDDVNGVENYDYAEEQNIPLGTTSVLKVNETILTKGWRTQASAITRMLMNHFLGRTSYNLNKTVDFLKSLMTAITDNMGVAEGFATLDANGRIPSGQLTEEVMEYKGEWNADTNTPELDEETGKKGDVYKVSVSGTQDLGEGEKYFRAGTYIIFNGTAYTVLSGEDVAKVNNIAPDNVGNVTLTGEDIATSSVDSMSLATKIKLNLKRSFGYLLGRYFEEYTFPFAFPAKPSIYYKNGKYFACGSSIGIKVSSDFKTWRDTNVTTGLYVIRYIKNIWIAIPTISDAGNVKYSTDGLTWTDTDITGVYVSTVETKDMVLVSIQRDSDAFLYKTIDGINWTLINTSNYPYTFFYFEGNRFFAFSRPYLYTSSDGENWVQTDMQSNFVNEIGSLAYKEGVWVACFIRKGIYYSVDGIHWTQTSITDDSYSKVVFANGLFVVASYQDSKAVKTSADGITWSNTNISKGESSFFYANGIWLLFTTEHVIYFSYDGTTWISSTLTSASLNSVSYFNGVFVATASAQGVYVSTNGVDWTSAQRSAVFANRKILPVLRTKDLFLYVTSTDSNPSYYISSLDLLEEKGWLNLD